ncbi:hypothetical protein ABZ634_25345, partial [Nocardiopsis alba]
TITHSTPETTPTPVTTLAPTWARSLLALDRRRARELAWIRFGPGADARGPLRTVMESPSP